MNVKVFMGKKNNLGMCRMKLPHGWIDFIAEINRINAKDITLTAPLLPNVPDTLYVSGFYKNQKTGSSSEVLSVNITNSKSINTNFIELTGNVLDH